MELPKEFKGTVYFYWNTDFELFYISATKLNNNAEYLLMGELSDVNVGFTLNHDEAVKQVVESLQNEKKNIQAKAQSDINKLDEKINSLLAITHQVDGER